MSTFFLLQKIWAQPTWRHYCWSWKTNGSLWSTYVLPYRHRFSSLFRLLASVFVPALSPIRPDCSSAKCVSPYDYICYSRTDVSTLLMWFSSAIVCIVLPSARASFFGRVIMIERVHSSAILPSFQTWLEMLWLSSAYDLFSLPCCRHQCCHQYLFYFFSSIYLYLERFSSI